jgi:hypothetical protein
MFLFGVAAARLVPEVLSGEFGPRGAELAWKWMKTNKLAYTTITSRQLQTWDPNFRATRRERHANVSST